MKISLFNKLSPLSFAFANKTCYQTCPITRFIRLFILLDKIDFFPYKTMIIINNLSDNIFWLLIVNIVKISKFIEYNRKIMHCY